MNTSMASMMAGFVHTEIFMTVRNNPNHDQERTRDPMRRAFEAEFMLTARARYG
jgi:hypothetical protein